MKIIPNGSVRHGSVVNFWNFQNLGLFHVRFHLQVLSCTNSSYALRLCAVCIVRLHWCVMCFLHAGFCWVTCSNIFPLYIHTGGAQRLKITTACLFSHALDDSVAVKWNIVPLSMACVILVLMSNALLSFEFCPASASRLPLLFCVLINTELFYL